MKKEVKRKDSTADYNNGFNNIKANPIIISIYEFLVEPRSSRAAYFWSSFLALIVVIRLLATGLESVDGPNQYIHRHNYATYKFLLSYENYWRLYIGCMIPLILDAIARLGVFFAIVLVEENKDLLKLFKSDFFAMILYFCDIFGISTFVVTALYVRPAGMTLTEGPRVILRLIELMICSKIFRYTKDTPAIWAIRIALIRSAPHLIVPLYFFFVFNICCAIIIYFLEPCYNVVSCPWVNLFDVSFFSIVTMTSTGYGNQVPTFQFGRLLACFIMLFGSLFMSMPLAIIGNEYENAWSEVNAMLEKEKQVREKRIEKEMESFASDPNSSASRLAPFIQAKEDEVRERADKEKFNRLVSESPLIIAYNEGKNASQKTLRTVRLEHRITPNLLMMTCVLRSYLSSLVVSIRSASFLLSGQMQDSLVKMRMYRHATLLTQNSSSDKPQRKLSVFGQRDNNNNNNSDDTVSKNRAEDNRFEKIMENDGSDNDSDGDKLEELRSPNIVPLGTKKTQVYDSKMIIEQLKMASSNDLRRYSTINKANAVDFLSRQKQQAPKLRKIILHEEKRPFWIRTLSYLQSLCFCSSSRKNSTEDDDAKFPDSFEDRVLFAASHPKDIRAQIWLILELPNSSWVAKAFQFVFSTMIFVAVFVFFTETMITLTPYGSHTPICRRLVSIYCLDKFNNSRDPGCFVYNQGPTNASLRFGCSEPDCFGVGNNFGSLSSPLSCSDGLRPFETQDELIYNYGASTAFTSRYRMHQINDVCNRVECTDNGNIVDGKTFWMGAEIITNAIFSLELVLRVFVSSSLSEFFKDKMNIFDLLSVIPFYGEIISAYTLGVGYQSIDFSILASSPDPIMLVYMRGFKIFRLFKLSRHFHATNVLGETAKKAWRQIVGIVTFLFFLMIVFSTMLFEVEGGTACYVGDVGCNVPPGLNGVFHDGQRIIINKKGDLSQFPTVFDGLWFTIVTLTTTGYGDVLPVTNIGQIMTIFLMLAGVMFLAMPLTAAASTFYRAHLDYIENRKRIEKERDRQRRQSTSSKNLEEDNVSSDKWAHPPGEMASGKVAPTNETDPLLSGKRDSLIIDDEFRREVIIFQSEAIEIDQQLARFVESLNESAFALQPGSMMEPKEHEQLSPLLVSESVSGSMGVMMRKIVDVSKLNESLASLLEDVCHFYDDNVSIARKLASISLKNQIKLINLSRASKSKEE